MFAGLNQTYQNRRPMAIGFIARSTKWFSISPFALFHAALISTASGRVIFCKFEFSTPIDFMISSSCFSRAIAIISPRKILGRSVPWCLPCDCLMLQIFNVCPWGIENQLHHIRDLTFGHDASRVRSGLAP
jgi:hypothetical protein